MRLGSGVWPAEPAWHLAVFFLPEISLSWLSFRSRYGAIQQGETDDFIISIYSCGSSAGSGSWSTHDNVASSVGRRFNCRACHIHLRQLRLLALKFSAVLWKGWEVG